MRLNPKNKRVIKELASIYQLHKTLLTAFPDKENGGPGRVLYRIDMDREQRLPEILVQSIKEPNWANLNVDGQYLLSDVQIKEFNPTFRDGQIFLFRLHANPTVKRDGKRLGILKDEDQVSWLMKKGEHGGFNILDVRIIPHGFHHSQRTDGKMTFLGVRYEGTLQVIDPEKFLTTLESGIGSAKGFGFGLLSIVPVRG